MQVLKSIHEQTVKKRFVNTLRSSDPFKDFYKFLIWLLIASFYSSVIEIILVGGENLSCS